MLAVVIRFCFFLLVLLGTQWPALAQKSSIREGVGPGQRYYPVHDFRNDFQVYDEVSKAYIPYLNELHAGFTALSVFVDLESNRHYKLLISTQQEGYLFVNAALKRQLAAQRWQVLDIDSLYQVYRRPEVFLTLYGSPGLNDKVAFIAYPKSATQKPVIISDETLSVKPRAFSVYDSFFTLGLLFLLASHAFLFTVNQRAFLTFYSPRELFALRVRDESFLTTKSLSGTTLLFTLHLSFISAYLLLFIQSRNIDLFTSRALLADGQPLSSLIANFFLFSVIVFVALIGKYIGIGILSELYKFRGVTNIHYFKILQSELLFLTTAALLVTIIGYNSSQLNWSSTYLLVPFVSFYLGRIVLLYLLISHSTPIKNLYLFSYLCLVELIPLIIGVRFAL